MRTIFFGTSAFAAKILSFLIDRSSAPELSFFKLVAIVTQPDRPKGRHLHTMFSPVKELACAKIPSCPILQPEKISTTEYADILKSYHPDLFLVVAYGEIIKQFLLDIPRLGSYNIHASLLPKYRGAAPIQRCLMNGETKTGINIITMTAQMDAGDIISSAEIAISEDMNFGQLEAALCDLACELTVEFLKQLHAGDITKTPQAHALATFAPKLSAEDQKIDWNLPAEAIHNRIRALSPSPGAWTFISLAGQQKKMKIKRAQKFSSSHAASPGTRLPSRNDEWIVACGKDALKLLEVQLEGKKNLVASDFLKGIQRSDLICI